MVKRLLRRFRRSEAGSVPSEHAFLLGVAGLILFLAVAVLAWPLLSGSSSLASPAPAPQREGRSYADDFDGKSNLEWVFSEGFWRREGGTLVGEAPTSMAVARLPANDYTVSLDLQTLPPTAERPGLSGVVFRVQDSRNYYALRPTASGTVELGKMQRGQWCPRLAWAEVAAAPMAPQRYSVAVSGNVIEVRLGGELILHYVDPQPVRSGGFGVQNVQSRARLKSVRADTSTPKVGGP